MVIVDNNLTSFAYQVTKHLTQLNNGIPIINFYSDKNDN